jgi:hypothetical protein
MDGTDDDMLWNGSEEDGNVNSEIIFFSRHFIFVGRSS